MTMRIVHWSKFSPVLAVVRREAAPFKLGTRTNLEFVREDGYSQRFLCPSALFLISVIRV
jgi:hypothetical protein